jgi:tetratricopeptide (TPR) repeat protein
MTDPITVGALVAWALGLGGEAIVKGAVGEAVKDAYQALKTRVSRWAAGDVEALENTPNSNTRQAVIAETVNQLSREDQEALRDLAQALAGKLKEQAPAIGLDVGRLDALEVQLGNISARQHHGDARHGHTHPGGAPAGDVQDGRYFSRPVTRKTVTAPESSQAAAAIGVQFAGETRIGTLMHQTNDPEIAANVRELLAIARRGGIFSAAEQNAISEAAVRAVVEKAGSIGIAANDLISWLEGWIADVLAERAARQRGSNEGPAFAAVQREAQRRFNIGRLDDTSQAFIEELEREERAERERQEERARGRLRLLEAAIEWDRLALNGPAAAAKLRRMAAIEHPNDVDAQARLLFDRAGEFYDQGEFKGDNAALLVAIAAFRAALEEWTRERAPLEWAMTQNNLGNALWTLGERESGTARLEEAVSAYRAALEEWTRERAPLDWAMTQNNLGSALEALGERESGTARLEEAVVAYDGALAIFVAARADYYESIFRKNRDRARAILDQRKS